MQDKSLGQHWLFDKGYLQKIVEIADVSPDDHVLEVGPGLGELTNQILTAGAKVTAVEMDPKLYDYLLKKRELMEAISSGRLVIHLHDILKFDLDKLPSGYKVVANIPYYLTGNLLRKLTDADNAPSEMTLLVQKEVAQRIAAPAGRLSVVAVVIQLFGSVELGPILPPEVFSPPPEVDSQVVKITRHQTPLFRDLDRSRYLRLVKAGFSQKRKKLRSSLSAGLGMKIKAVENMLATAKIDPNRRAQELSLKDWNDLAKIS